MQVDHFSAPRDDGDHARHLSRGHPPVAPLGDVFEPLRTQPHLGWVRRWKRQWAVLCEVVLDHCHGSYATHAANSEQGGHPDAKGACSRDG